MKITSLTIGGFKGIKNKATIPLAPITLFFGANSTGKSTVLHALLYLYEVIAKRNFDAQYSSIAGEALYFGGFHNLVHGKHLDGVITLGATLDFRDGAADIWDDYLSEPERELVEEALNTSPDFEAEVLSFEIDIRWDKQKNSVFISRYESRVSDGLVFKSVATEGKHYISIPFFNPLVNSGINSVEFEQSEGLNILGGEIQIKSVDALPKLSQRIDLSRYPVSWEVVNSEHPLCARLMVEGVMSQVALAPIKILIKKLDALLHIGPLRVLPSRATVLNSEHSSKRWYDGTSGWERFAFADESIKQKINEKFSSSLFFGTNYSFAALSYGEATMMEKAIVLKDSHAEIPLSPSSVGVGVSQVFPFVVATSLEQNLIVSCEQPELHIHPKWQLSLADMMLEAVHKNPERMFFIESHSEHILLRLLKRRRQTADGEISYLPFGCKKQDVQIVFCEQLQGQTKLLPIKTTDEGEFDAPWPNGFFEERGEELF
ncbi:AAA family ATPase [Vibrio parahaemolyticus]|uniref:AAA family ATPase n=2 Tax=Vibrio parahaemolyticus TaxID=670 RepID=UPI00112031F6|nr:AAA family ATPase [Vibrio parahaemolyticus]ELA9308881.1 AAA family ATPase [Vibrio parahaemolyticus]MBE4112641.1 AAA family ATPase [Vibrio parahaemolyticus]TOI21499.1 hypothetical protein CGI65_13430 [Vibrio parahaemolyticus]TOI71636.1 hypothetical protein CGI53_23020 [Vibrio parahaemolyticus]TOI76486.1 hypothetical protein CGI52_18695 [Vibrio parahaemolyticus]